MNYKLLLIILPLLLVTQNCNQHSDGKRKIKLAKGVINQLSQNRNDRSTVLKFDDHIQRSIAILTFENQTGDQKLSWLSQGITDMLIRDLSQSRYLKVATIQRILDIFKSLKIQSPTKIDYKMLSQIGKQAQAEAIIKGKFSGEKDSLVINVQLYNVNSGMIFQEKSVSGQGLEQIFSMVDELSSSIRTDLRLSLEEMEDFDLSIADITTKSLEAYKYYTEGFDLIYKAYFGDALKKFERTIEIDSTFAMAHFWACVAYFYLGQINEGRQAIEKAVELSEHVTPKEKMKIKWLQFANNNEHDKSFEMVKKIVQKYPNDKEMRYHLSVYHYYRQETEAAEKQLKQTLKLDPSFILAYILQSDIFSERGEYDSAVVYLEKSITINPEDAAPCHDLGDVYLAQGKYRKAVKYYKKALSIKPDFHFSVLSLAHTYAILGKYEKARERYISALQILPSEELKASVYSGLAWIEMSFGKYNQAIEYMRQALTYPSSEDGKAQYLTMLATMYFRKGIYDSTIVLTSKALCCTEQNIAAHSMMGQAYLKKGEVDSAKQMAQSIDQFIQDSKLERFRNVQLNLLAKIAQAEKRYEEAVNYYERILADNLEATSIYRELGKTYFEYKKPSQAIACYQKYKRHRPNDALIHYHLALANDAAGKKRKATKEMRKFLKMWNEADEDIPELVKAKKYLEES